MPSGDRDAPIPPKTWSGRVPLGLPELEPYYRITPEERREPHYRQVPVEELEPVPRQPVHIILDNIRSAFNTGSIFRTADAGAVAHIHCCGMTAYPPNPKLAKTALGAIDYVPWSYHVATPDAVAAVQAAGIAVVSIEVTETAELLHAFEWPRPTAIVFGNEVAGVMPEVIEASDAVVKIPMRGYKNTINVATAFGIVLFEVLRQWGAPE